MSNFYDACTLLGQLGMNGVTEKSADQKLRGFAWNKPGPDGPVLLAEMAWEGRPRAVAYLLSKGADPNRASGRFMKGPALAHAITSNSATARAKLEIVETLLAHDGIDIDAKVTVPPHPRDEANPFRTGTTLDYALDEAMHELKIGKAYDADSQRHARGKLQSYRQTIPLLVAAGATVSAQARKRMKKLGVGEIAPKPAGPPKNWAAKARAAVAKQPFPTRDAVFRLCDESLSSPAAVADRAWTEIVAGIIAASPEFEKVAEHVYGEPVSFEDDEGSLCQGWDGYVLLDLVFELLAKQATLASPRWASLVEKALRARARCHAVDETQSAVDDLFACAWVKKHRDVSKLRALEKKTR